MSNLLTLGDLVDLTGTPQKSRHAAILRDMGLHPLERPDGSVAISWDAVNAVMQDASLNRIEGHGVNWEAMGGAEA